MQNLVTVLKPVTALSLRCSGVLFGFGLLTLLVLSSAAPAMAQFSALKQLETPAANTLLKSVAVLGKDNRRSLPKKYRHMRRIIGILHNPHTSTLCSAFCVAPNVIATAAHCFFTRKAGQPLRLSDFRFTLNFGRNRRSFARLAGYRTGQSRLYIAAGTSGLSRRPPIGASKDWALARLARPYCRHGSLPITPKSVPQLIKASKRRQVLQLAFHLDFKNWRLAYSQPCSIKRSFGKMSWKNIKTQFTDPEELILHTCDTAGASSGSPILIDTKDGLSAVAINVGTYQQRNVLIRDGRVVKRSSYKTIANTAVKATAFFNMAHHVETAAVINTRGHLITIQRGLSGLGFYSGKVDGIMGRLTEAAIKKFQQRYRVAVTGLATTDLMLEIVKATEQRTQQDARFAPTQR